MQELEEIAAELNEINQCRADAIGVQHGRGDTLQMDTNSLRAFTVGTVNSMREIFDRINAVDPSVAAKLDTRNATEKECELWWALIRSAALDPAFDMLMYIIVKPKVTIEHWKRLTNCFFNYETTDRAVDNTSYCFRSFDIPKYISFLRLFGASLHNPPRIMERSGPVHSRKVTGDIVASDAGVWEGIGSVTRVERRCDQRHLAEQQREYERNNQGGDVNDWADGQIGDALRAMDTIRRFVKRMREQMLRTRMRQANGTSCKVLAREEIDEIREVEYSNQPVSGSPLLKLPLLQRGTLLVERLNEAMTDGAVQHRRWGLMRVCTEVFS